LSYLLEGRGRKPPACSGAGQTPGSPSGKAEETNDATATAGALGSMVQSKGQHGEGKVSGSDKKISEFTKNYEAASGDDKKTN